MPELPEVEIARRALARWTADRVVTAVEVVDPAVVRSHLSSRPSDAAPDGGAWLRASLPGTRPGIPLRIGKRIGWRFTGAADAALLVHLGMTGKWVRRGAGELPRAGRLCLRLDDGAGLWFVDPRRFGCVTPVDGADLPAALARGLGPDALEAAPGPAGLRARLTGRRPIKVALLDQQALAGVGNIQAAEALWRARIHPELRADALSDAQWEALAAELPAQLRATIAGEAEGEIRYLSEGGVENPFAVYGREGAPCRRCGALVERIHQAGRATCFCPVCQPT